MSPAGRFDKHPLQYIDDLPCTSTAFESGGMAHPRPGSSLSRQQSFSPRSAAEQHTGLVAQHPSPLSDSLLLALRRSRPDTRLFRALFQYIPIRDSPNENPHLELPLQAGDYVLVHGQMDEDQFYFGETLNGRTGLVPSNYVERVPDHVLLQNASRAPSPGAGGLTSSMTNLSTCEASTSAVGCAGAAGHRSTSISAGATVLPGFLPVSEEDASTSARTQLLSSLSLVSSGGAAGAMQRPGSPSFTLNVPPHHSRIVHDFTDAQLTPLPDSVCPYPPVDVSKVTVQEIKQPDQPRVPFPRELTVEKKLSRSVVISWLPPEDKLIAVSQYHICANGELKIVVPGTYKCKALIEGLDLDSCVNISVRAVTEHGHCPDAACTIAVGAEAPVAPQHVRVSTITPISACLSWYPSNSNAEHVILLNAIKVGVCPPSVFQVQLNGLQPSTIYRLSVRTKHPKAVLEQRPVERCVDFKTLPKIGLPDPPTNVQVEVGPQPGTLLISWKPVSSQPRPPSRAAVHSYLVFADGRNIAQVSSATADHVLLRLADFADDPPIFITVRTRTREGAVSADSNVVRVPRGISAANPNVLPGSGQLPFSSSIAVNTATGPFTTTSLSNSLIGNVIQPQQNSEYIQSAMNTLAMPYGMAQNSAISTGSAPPGLLTTFPSQQPQQLIQPQPSHISANQPHYPPSLHQMYNTAYPLTQSAILPSSQSTGNTALYGASAGPSSGGLLNGSTAQLADWKQQQVPVAPATVSTAVGAQRCPVPQQSQPSSQYYTFHPNSLYKEFTGADNKPSVLEMENNYLLKHRQQQQQQHRDLGLMDRWMGGSATLNRYDYYGGRSNGRYDDMGVRGMSRPMMMGGRKPTAIPPRLARVRSEEILGTRSEPDLRPMAFPDEDENCRYFLTLYDYDHMMSPNPNAQQEELSFRKHQVIKVYGDVDADGFYRGVLNRRWGLVPSNMVTEIAKDDYAQPRRRSDAYPVEPAIRRMRWGSLKSRSYDNAGERRRRGILPGATYTQSHSYMGGASVMPGAPLYSSLDRREHSLPPSSRYFDRSGVGGYDQQVSSARSYGGPRGYSYGYSNMPPGRGDYSMRDHHYDAGGPEIYEGSDTRDYRRGLPVPDEYGHDSYHWDYANDHRDARDVRDARDYRYDHAYEDERYPPPTVQQRVPMRRDYPRYAEAPTQQWKGTQPPSHDQYEQPPPRQQPQQPLPASGTMQQRYQPAAPSYDDRYARTNGEAAKRLVAKYDYDPKNSSPNVDAEQLELSFRQGDIITVLGEMDEDGFYFGELNGQRGMVPSNFLQDPTQLDGPPPPMRQQLPLMPSMQVMQQQPQSIMVTPNAAEVQAAAARPKGVAFSETTKKPMPARQSSQTSNKVSGGAMTSATGAAGSSSAMAKVAKAGGASATSAAGKTLAKKSSDLGSKGVAANVARKSSQAAKKADGKKK